jgi:ABC-type Mn2+/Zn2+ transport system ATPase subunit
VQRALDRLDLLAFAQRPLTTLSGGERQRVFIARALAQGASILLLDEHTTALDVGHQQQVLELIDDLRREHGLTVVSTLHDLTLAGQYGDRLVLLSEGRWRCRDPPGRCSPRQTWPATTTPRSASSTTAAGPSSCPADRSGGPSSPACHQALWSVLFAGGPQLPGNRPGTEVPGWQAVRT